MPVTIDAMMRHIFKKYDKDKSGFIDQAELKDVLRDLSIKFTEEQAASLYKSMDRNGTGQIEIEEVGLWVLCKYHDSCLLASICLFPSPHMLRLT